MSISFKDDYYRLHVIEMVQHREPDVFTDEVLTEIINCAKDKNYSSYSSLISSYLNIKNDTTLKGFLDDIYTLMQRTTLLIDTKVLDAFKGLYEKWNKNYISLYADMINLFKRPIYYRNSLDIDTGYYTLACYREYLENDDNNKAYQLHYYFTGNALSVANSPTIIGSVVGRGYISSTKIKCLETTYTTENSMSCISSCLHNPYFKMRSLQNRSKKAMKQMCTTEHDTCKCTKFAKLQPSNFIIWCIWLHHILDSVENNPKYSFIFDKLHRKFIDLDTKWDFTVDAWYMKDNSDYRFTDQEINKFIDLLLEDKFYAFNNNLEKCIQHIHEEQVLEHNRESEDNITPTWVNFGQTSHKELTVPSPLCLYLPVDIKYFENTDYAYAKLCLLPSRTKFESDMVDCYYVYKDKHTNNIQYFIEYYANEYVEKQPNEFNIIEQEYFDLLFDFLQQHCNTHSVNNNEISDIDKYFI